MLLGMDAVMSCYWDLEGTCRHPLISGIATSPEVCGACKHFKKQPVMEEGPPPPRPNLAERAVSWVKAEASMVLQGPLSDASYEARIAICNGCDALEKAVEPDKVGFCKACGCGHNVRAELTIKGRMPAAKCPRNLWPKEAN